MNDYKKIHEFPNYCINSNGDVKNIKRNYLLKPFVSNSGYKRLALFKNGKTHKVSIHRLVAMMYLGLDYNNKSIQVNHKDFNKLNNNKENLELLSLRENIVHYTSTKNITGSTFIRKGVYNSSISINNTKISLGRCCSDKDANLLYNTAIGMIDLFDGNLINFRNRVRIKCNEIYNLKLKISHTGLPIGIQKTKNNTYSTFISIFGKNQSIGVAKTLNEAIIYREYAKVLKNKAESIDEFKVKLKKWIKERRNSTKRK